MSSFSYAIDMNIRRYKNLLATSISGTERETIETLLAEENAKFASLPTLESNDAVKSRRVP